MFWFGEKEPLNGPRICEIDDTDTQLDQAFLFGGFHKWVLILYLRMENE